MPEILILCSENHPQSRFPLSVNEQARHIGLIFGSDSEKGDLSFPDYGYVT